MEENKKRKLRLGILIGILISIIIGLTVFIVYDKVLSNDNNEQSEIGNDFNNNEEEKVTETDLDLSSTLVTSLSKVFYGKYLITEVSEYDNYFYKQDKTVISNLPDLLKMVMTFRYLDNPEKVTVEEYEVAYRQIFGSDATPVILDKTNDCKTNYELVNGVYQHPEGGGCGGAGASITISKLISAKQIQNNNQETIIISEAVAFISGDKSYKDVNYTQFVEDYNGNSLDSDYLKYAQYDYIFEKDEYGIYVFTRVEKVK